MKVFPILAALAVLASGCGTALGVTEEALAPETQSTKIFAADGSLITTLRQEENRESLPLTDIPRHVRDAVVAVEDARFYTHKGVDAKAILRAMYANVSSGQVQEGGSTITQQLVRNAIEDVGREQTLERKLREATYAYQVDSTFSKEKILELYMNTVYFGEGAYGIQTAAQTYFRKDAKDLTISEGALLAGLIKSPVNFSPHTNADRALQRRNFVLQRMVDGKFIDQATADASRAEPLAIQEKRESSRYPFAYFVDLVTRAIQHEDEFEPLGESVATRGHLLFRGGLRIHTTLDPRMQSAAEEAVSKVLDQPDRDPSAALVAIEPSSGHIKALVGGRDFFAPREQDPCVIVRAVNADGSPKTCAKVNLALGLKGGGSGRQSGSSFKPFVLAAALSNGKTLQDTYRASACMDIPNADAGGTRPWHVCNYEESAFGSTSLMEATVKSVNTVYAQLIMDVGAGTTVDFAHMMGVESPMAKVPSAALGANAVSPLDMAAGFSTFSNMGTKVDPVFITKITSHTGETLWEPHQERREVMSAGVAYMALQAMQEVIHRGTGVRAKIGRPAYGKTGTAQEWRDAWFVGGAGTDLVASVAVFWPDGEIEMKPSCSGSRTEYRIVTGSDGTPRAIPPECRPTRIRVTGGSWPAQIWQLFMLKALEGIPASTFPEPKVDLVKVKVDVKRGCLPNQYTPAEDIATREYIKGAEPTKVCTEPTAPVTAKVPKVIGFPDAEAVRLLESQGFKVQRSEVTDSTYPPGTVTRQEPGEGSAVRPGSTVTIFIANTDRRTVPNVVNMSDKDAKDLLQKEGFAVSVERHESCKGETKCVVTEQSPPGGSKVPQGSRVTIWVKPVSGEGSG